MGKIEKLLTVVVPVYKVEPYINKCLDSLLVPEEQLDKLEVIIVNDGTPDRSAEMAREYEKLYPETFRVIDKENGGHGSAWNRGLQEATGKYLRFLDSDDWFDTETLSVLMERLEQLDVDLILSPYKRFYVETQEYKEEALHCTQDGLTSAIEDFKWSEEEDLVSLFHGCTYRTTMLQAEAPLFLEKIFYDDTILAIAPIMLGNSVHVFNKPLYYYLIGRPGQTISAEVWQRNMGFRLKTYMQVFEFYRSHASLVNDKERTFFVSRLLNTWLKFYFVYACGTGYSPAKNYLKDWAPVFKEITQNLHLSAARMNLIQLYFRLPYPLFYIAMKIISSILSVARNKVTGEENRIE